MFLLLFVLDRLSLEHLYLVCKCNNYIGIQIFPFGHSHVNKPSNLLHTVAQLERKEHWINKVEGNILELYLILSLQTVSVHRSHNLLLVQVNIIDYLCLDSYFFNITRFVCCVLLLIKFGYLINFHRHRKKYYSFCVVEERKCTIFLSCQLLCI